MFRPSLALFLSFAFCTALCFIRKIIMHFYSICTYLAFCFWRKYQNFQVRRRNHFAFRKGRCLIISFLFSSSDLLWNCFVWYNRRLTFVAKMDNLEKRYVRHNNSSSFLMHTPPAALILAPRLIPHTYQHETQTPASLLRIHRRHYQHLYRKTTSMPLALTTPLRGDQHPQIDDDITIETIDDQHGYKLPRNTVLPTYFTHDRDVASSKRTIPSITIESLWFPPFFRFFLHPSNNICFSSYSIRSTAFIFE